MAAKHSTPRHAENSVLCIGMEIQNSYFVYRKTKRNSMEMQPALVSNGYLQFPVDGKRVIIHHYNL